MNKIHLQYYEKLLNIKTSGEQKIFIKVIGNILISVEEYVRTVEVILYYPSDDYIYFLENNTCFVLSNEIKLPYLYDNDPRHSFLVYRLNYRKNILK